MPATIQGSDETKKLLYALKRKRHPRSYDEVIKALLGPITGIPKSIFGSCRGSLRFKREKEKDHVF